MVPAASPGMPGEGLTKDGQAVDSRNYILSPGRA